MYQVEFSAADLNWQILMLQEFPEIANKRFYPAMHRATTFIQGSVYPQIPIRTGLARSEFRKAVSGKGLNITGRVGWKFGSRAWYVIPLEYGAKAHMIEPRTSGGFLRLYGNVFVKSVNHPGIPALKFMERGQANAKSQVDPEMERAMNETVNDLAKK